MVQTNKFILWLFTNPKAMKVLMIYSTIIGIVLFSGLFLLAIYLKWWWGSWIIFGLLTILAVYKCYKTRKQLKMIDYTLGEFMDITAVHEEEKEKNKDKEVDNNECGEGGEADDGEFEAAESGDKFYNSEQGLSDDGESAGEKHKKSNRRVQECEEESESTDISFMQHLRHSKIDSGKAGNSNTDTKNSNGN